MNRLASRDPATTAVATWAMPSSSANATDASISARPTPCRRNSGNTCGETVWTTGSRLSGVMVAARRCTAPASWPSYSATTIRSSCERPDPLDDRAQVGGLLLAIDPSQHVRPQIRQLVGVFGHSTAQGHQVTRHRYLPPLLVVPLCPRARTPPGETTLRVPVAAEETRVIPGIGTVVNVVTVLVGTGLGVLLGNRLPERTRDVVTDGLGLVTLLIAGLSAIAVTDDDLTAYVGDSAPMLIVLGSLVIGGIIGSLLRLEERRRGARRLAPDPARRRHRVGRAAPLHRGLRRHRRWCSASAR